MNKLNRQTFKLGNANRKLQLIHPQADDEQGGDDEGLGLGEEDDQEVREDNLDLLTRTDEDNTGEESETQNDIISGNKNHRYNLRPRKAKTVSLTRIIVNKTELVSDKFKQKSILKQRDYNQKENFEITNFQLSDRFHFLANKKALLQHESTCLTEDCVECAVYKSVKKLAFQSNSLLG